MNSTSDSPKSVLFVCLGNICRSPTGEGVMQHLVNQRDCSELIDIDSAGTIGYHEGKPADFRMQAAARKRGYDLTSRSRKIVYGDLENFDLVVAMDRDNHADILLVHPEPKTNIKMLSDFLGDDWPTDVPDPYYGGDEGFEYVLDMIEAACPKILEHLLSQPPETTD
ncbi:MAG: low molecular weight protein-tyrosine-phosphatase [Mariniblastus sp.]